MEEESIEELAFLDTLLKRNNGKISVLGAITKVEKSVGWTFDVNFCYCKGAAKC